jgi:hypothetical protein
VWGWNPLQGGDHWNHGSPVLSTRVDADAVTVRTRALEWMPAGGTADKPVPSDAVIEQRISPVAGDVRAWRVDFRVDLDGSAPHQLAFQELPAVYAGSQYQRLVTYGGKAPWTHGDVSVTVPLMLGQTPVRRFSSEAWFSLVDDSDFGVTVFAPGGNPYVSGFLAPGSGGPTGAAAAFARFDAPLALQGGRPVVGHYYLLVGDYRRARETIYRLRALDDAIDLAAPRLALDRPSPDATVSGAITVAGWAYDNLQLASLAVFVDAEAAGPATRGVARADVAQVYEDAPPDSGFGLMLDTRRWANGTHTVKVVATDAAGNQSEAQVQVSVAN